MMSNKIVSIRFDFGGEFINTAMSTYLKDHGIHHQLTGLHTLKQNGYVERKHTHLVETTRTMLAASKVPHIYWVEAFFIAIYPINTMPIMSRPSPWESLFHKFHSYSSLRIFGCSYFPWLKPYTTSKLDPKSKLCVFLGYSLNNKGYRCPQTKRIYISRHVLFHESQFHFHQIGSSSSASVPPSSQNVISYSTPATLTFSQVTPHSTSSVPLTSSFLATTQPITSLSPATSTTSLSPQHPILPPTHTLPQTNNCHIMQTKLKSSIFKQKTLLTIKHHLPFNITKDYMPSTYIMAFKYAHWRQAMQE